MGIRKKVTPYGRRAEGTNGPMSPMRIRLPVSEIESPSWYIDSKGHIFSRAEQLRRKTDRTASKMLKHAKGMVVECISRKCIYAGMN